MTLLALYLGALIIGGGLLAVSFLGGGDHGDHDADADADHDLDHGGADGEHVGVGDALWLPILSLRFWTFFLAFFGLTGSLITAMAGAGLLGGHWGIGLGLSIALGLASGYAISAILRALKQKRVSSDVVPEVDYIGKVGEVLLDVAPGDPGQVRLDVKGSSIDLPALVEAGATGRLKRGAQVLVMGWSAGKLTVAAFEGEGDKARGERVPV
jgi:hypothetical protein